VSSKTTLTVQNEVGGGGDESKLLTSGRDWGVCGSPVKVTNKKKIFFLPNYA